MRQMRLFVAINFPDVVKQSLGTFINHLRDLTADAKWVEAGNLHLTVQFLGNVPEDQVPAVVTALNRSVAGVASFRLNVSGVGVFPSVQRPRVLWAGVEGETSALIRLHRQVQRELEQLGFEPENRRFSPHLTLARVRSPLGFPAVMEKAEEIAGKKGKFGSADIVSVDLMLSELSPRGPQYSVLARIPIAGASGLNKGVRA